MFSVEDVLHIVCCSYLMESIDCDPSLDYSQQLLVIVVHMTTPIYPPPSLWLYTSVYLYSSSNIPYCPVLLQVLAQQIPC